MNLKENNRCYKYRHNVSLLHYLLIFIGVFLLLQNLLLENFKQWPIIYQTVKYVDEVFPILILGLIVLSRIVQKRKLVRTNIDLPICLFLLLGIISSISNQVPLLISASQLLLYIKGFILFYIFTNLSMNIRILHKYLHALLWVALVIFLLGIIDLAAPQQFRTITGNVTSIEYYNKIPTVKSLFTHPAVFGWFMSFAALYCFAFFIIFKRMPYFFTFVVFFLGCFLAMKVKAIIGLIAGLLIGLFFLPIKKLIKSSILIIFFAIICLFFFWPSISELFQSKIDIYVQSESYMEVARNVLYMKSFDIAKDFFPLGSGLGRYGSWISKVHYSPIYEKYGLSKIWGMSKDEPKYINDTFWPMVLGEIGFIGLVLYLGILLIFGRSLYKQIRYSENKYIKAFQLGTFMMLIESLFESIANPIYTSPPYHFFLFGSIGICYALNKTIETKSRLTLTDSII